MLTARIVFDHPSVSVARCVLRSLEPDNLLSAAEMRVTANVKAGMLYVNIRRCPTVETMRSTLDDLFRCARVAEDAISLARTTWHDEKIKKDKRFK